MSERGRELDWFVELIGDRYEDLITRVLYHTQDVKQGGKKDQDSEDKSTQLSTVTSAFAANGNHDKKNEEITHPAYSHM